MAKLDSEVWKHLCRAIRAISYRYDESCPYCGITRIEAQAKARRQRRPDEEGGEEDEDGEE